jgi:hypothetical protein
MEETYIGSLFMSARKLSARGKSPQNAKMVKYLSLLIRIILCFTALGAEELEEYHQRAACNVGQVYCYYEIVNDLRMLY